MKKFTKILLNVQDLKVSPADVIHYTGDNNPEKNPFYAFTEELLQSVSEEKISGIYKIFRAKPGRKHLIIGTEHFLPGEEVISIIKNSEIIVVFACTLGNTGNRLLQSINKDDISEAYITDVLGTVMIEKMLQKIIEKLRHEYEYMDMKVGNTVSPGNCGWAVEEQKKIFRLLPADIIGISLNPYGMMHPVKSLTGIVGVGQKVKFKHTDCTLCPSKNCMYRKKAYKNLQLYDET